MKAYLLLDMAKENKKEWRDITNNYSEKDVIIMVNI